jgi:GMP reductase
MNSHKFYDYEEKLDFSDVLIVPGKHAYEVNAEKIDTNMDSRLTSRADVNLSRKFFVYNKHYEQKGTDYTPLFHCVPIIAANMDGVGTVEMGKALAKNNMLTCLNKSIPDSEIDAIEDTDNLFLTIGISEKDFEKVEQYKDKFLKICIDVPNGYLQYVTTFVNRVRKLVTDAHFIMAGNVVTPEAAIALYQAGANCVKVGIGSGSVCTTRLKAGTGFPQLSAILEVRQQASHINAVMHRKLYICSDGGCTNPGDVAKALAAGADFVMLGGMLAGHDEGGGEIYEKLENPTSQVVVNPQTGQLAPVIKSKKFVEFYGMSSKTANDKHSGGLKGYRAAEGKEVQVEYRGPVQDTIDDILGGLRSACTYVVASNLPNLLRNSKFIKVRRQVNNIFDSE